MSIRTATPDCQALVLWGITPYQDKSIQRTINENDHCNSFLSLPQSSGATIRIESFFVGFHAEFKGRTKKKNEFSLVLKKIQHMKNYF